MHHNIRSQYVLQCTAHDADWCASTTGGTSNYFGFSRVVACFMARLQLIDLATNCSSRFRSDKAMPRYGSGTPLRI